MRIVSYDLRKVYHRDASSLSLCTNQVAARGRRRRLASVPIQKKHSLIPRSLSARGHYPHRRSAGPPKNSCLLSAQHRERVVNIVGRKPIRLTQAKLAPVDSIRLVSPGPYPLENRKIGPLAGFSHLCGQRTRVFFWPIQISHDRSSCANRIGMVGRSRYAAQF